MKVLHVIPSVSSVHGGPSTALVTMTRALAQAGIEVEVATTDDDGAGKLAVPLGQPVQRGEVVYRYFARQTGFYKFSLPLTQWLARNITRFDVVHIHALFSYASLPAAYFAARHKIPYVVRPLGTLNRYGMTRHHPRFKRVSYTLVERRLLAGAACMHYTSAQERDEASALGVTTRSAIIPHGIDVAAFSGSANRAWLETHAPHLNGRTIFLHLGRLDPKKGIERVLAALAEMQDEPVGLVVAGDGEPEYVRALKRRAAELGLGDAVEWAGFVTGDEKAALLHAVDCFVLASYSENFGVAVVEAMAAGLPVIVTPDVAIAEDISACGAGLAAANDVELLEAMRAVALNESGRRERGARGKQLAAEKFSIDAMTRGLIAMYRDCA